MLQIYNILRDVNPMLSFLGGSILLFLLILTTTFDKPLLRYARVLLAMPACILSFTFAFPSAKYTEGLGRGLRVELCAIGMYGLMRILDVAVVGFRDRPNDRPRWVLQHKRISEEGGVGSKEGPDINEERLRPVVLPMLNNLGDRLLYSLDLFQTVRGASIVKGRIFDFANRDIQKFHPPESRLAFWIGYLPTFLSRYILLDLFDTINKSRIWDTASEHPVTSLPFHLQLIHTASIVFGVMSSMANSNDMFLTIPSMVFLRAPTKSFPPLFNSPLYATSLADWWSRRWHSTWRQWFHRLSLPIIWALPKNAPPYLKKFIRTATVFLISTILHLIIGIAIPPDAQHPHLAWWNLSTIKFFMLQPLGLLLELAVINPVTKGLSAGARSGLRRLFPYIWLLWTGRYYADGFVIQGLLNPGEYWVALSPIRGLFWGRWIVV